MLRWVDMYNHLMKIGVFKLHVQPNMEEAEQLRVLELRKLILSNLLGHKPADLSESSDHDPDQILKNANSVIREEDNEASVSEYGSETSSVDQTQPTVPDQPPATAPS